jgi:hypothetical protein
VTVFLIALGVFAVLAVAILIAALRSMRAEFEEIPADPRATSALWSRHGRQVVADRRRHRRADVLRRYADAGRPVHGPAGEMLTPEQLRFAAELIEKERP